MRQDVPRGAGSTSTPREPPRHWKRIVIGDDSLEIAKGREPNQYDVRVYSDVGHLPMSVIVHRGVVRPIWATVCHGLERRADYFAAELTKRLKL
jgi:hypothetical protein